jgi:hypothetical protein
MAFYPHNLLMTWRPGNLDNDSTKKVQGSILYQYLAQRPAVVVLYRATLCCAVLCCAVLWCGVLTWHTANLHSDGAKEVQGSIFHQRPSQRFAVIAQGATRLAGRQHIITFTYK